MSDDQAAYFARVQPIVGDCLRDKRVALLNLAVGAETARLLAACRVEHWLLPADGDVLAAELCARYGVVDTRCGWTDAEMRSTDLLVGGGSLADCQQLAAACAAYSRPGLALLSLAEGGMLISLRGADAPDQLESAIGASSPAFQPSALSPQPSVLDYLDLSHHAARLARRILLGETSGSESWRFGDATWPWRVSEKGEQRFAPTRHATIFQIPPQHSALCPQHSNPPQPSFLVLGCGSVGSYLARDVALAGASRLLLLDDEDVAAANPVRQFYTRQDIGASKTARLAENIGAVASCCMAVGRRFRLDESSSPSLSSRDARLGDETEFARLVESEHPDVVVLATGTNADYRAARLLRRMGVAHLVARCYPRARYFEVVLVDGKRGPCYDCVRGHLYTGPIPALTAEQRAAYDAHGGTLVAEPATLVESGWAAAVAARLAMQLALPASARAAWFERCIEEQAVCFIGGNVAERRPNGWAYGISSVGQVVTYGMSDIIGSVGAEARPCLSCGQVYTAGRLV